MPFGWLTLCRSAQELVKTSLRGDKSSIGKVGTRCEEAEVQRLLTEICVNVEHSKCMVNLPRSGYLIEYLGAALCMYWGRWDQCWPPCEYVQDLQVRGGSVWSIAQILQKVCMFMYNF